MQAINFSSYFASRADTGFSSASVSSQPHSPYQISISPYSSLAGAIHPTAVNRTQSGTVHRTQTISISHPYHAPQRRGPGRPRTTSSSPESLIRQHDEAEEGNFIRDAPPPNFILVPQPRHRENIKTERLDPFARRPPILFRYISAGTVGVAVGSFLPEYVPDIIGRDDKVLDDGYREIKVHVLWPGYEPFYRRVRTHSGLITRIELLADIVNLMMNRIKYIKDSRTKIKPGHEAYALDKFDPACLSLTGLLHRGGSNWQLEIWVPESQAMGWAR